MRGASRASFLLREYGMMWVNTDARHKERMGMKRGRLRAFLLALSLLLVLGQSGRASQVGTARFPILGKDYAWAIPFDDSMLTQDGTKYHQPLARSSLGLALSAFRLHRAGLQGRGNNVRAYLTELGFAGLKLEQFAIEPTIDTIATAMAHKRVGTGDAQATVVAVAVSGGGYVDEWKSNFLIGNGMHHQGFDQAAQKVYARLTAYIREQRITGRVKVWIAGYSRAAATGNRTAAIILDHQLVKPNDLYAYTFATPNVTRQTDAARYSSIFNIVGSFDPVPLIPFDDWGFRRYGRDMYLPTPECDSDYAKRVAPVSQMYRRMTGQEYWTSISRNRTIQKLLGALKDSAGDVGEYTADFQPLLIQLWGDKDKPLNMLGSAVRSFFNNNALWKRSSKLAGSLWTLFSNTFEENMLQQEGVLANEWRSDSGVLLNYAQEHVPIGYLAWLMAYDAPEKMVTTSLRYRQVSFSWQPRVSALDAQGKEVFTRQPGELNPAEGTVSPFSPSQVGDSLVMTVPADKAYTLRIQAEDNSPLVISVREGVIGRVQMKSYEGKVTPQQVGDAWTLALPQGLPGTGYTLIGPAGGLLMTAVADASVFSEQEVNSSIKGVFNQNLTRLIAVLVLALLQAIFVITLTTRAGRHLYLRRRQIRLKQVPEGPRAPT